jgi:hypothetical protein
MVPSKQILILVLLVPLAFQDPKSSDLISSKGTSSTSTMNATDLLTPIGAHVIDMHHEDLNKYQPAPLQSNRWLRNKFVSEDHHCSM